MTTFQWFDFCFSRFIFEFSVCYVKVLYTLSLKLIFRRMKPEIMYIYAVSSEIHTNICALSCLFAVRSCTGSRLHNVRISGAAIGLKTATADIDLQDVHLMSNLEGLVYESPGSNEPLMIRNSVFERNKNNGLLMNTNSNLTLIGCRFRYNTFGVSANIGGTYQTTVEVVDSEFAQNSQHGFITSRLSHISEISFTNTVFVACSLYLSTSANSDTPLNIALDRCSFSAMKYNKLYLSFYYTSDVHLAVTNCVLRDMYYGPTIVCGRGSTINVRNVTVEHIRNNGFYIQASQSSVSVRDSKFNDNGNAIAFVQTNSGLPTGNITLANNEFTDNSGNTVMDINTQIDIVIENNIFVNNTAKVTVNYVPNNRGNLRCARNVFENPRADYELQVGSHVCAGCLRDARYNWWGSANNTAIPQRIHDFFLDMDLAEARLSPVLASSSVDSTSYLELTDREFKLDDHTIGGRIKENTSIVIDDNRRQVRYTIHVPVGKKLVLHLSVPLMFDSNRGILVEGMEYM